MSHFQWPAYAILLILAILFLAYILNQSKDKPHEKTFLERNADSLKPVGLRDTASAKDDGAKRSPSGVGANRSVSNGGGSKRKPKHHAKSKGGNPKTSR